jgi:hypothetical protein
MKASSIRIKLIATVLKGTSFLFADKADIKRHGPITIIIDDNTDRYPKKASQAHYNGTLTMNSAGHVIYTS